MAQSHDASFHEEESDHPTDFSALFADGGEEDTVVFKKPQPPPPPLGRPPAGCTLDEDTVHTYATKGKLYQTGTPYSFSMATCPRRRRRPADGGRRGPAASSGPASALETPLISRSTSVGSLSSFEGANATGEQGSEISEYSRQVSGAVSPSDLPDSPSEMPGTPQQPRKQDKPEPRGGQKQTATAEGRHHGRV